MTIHEIPARLFFKILESGNFLLLDTKGELETLESDAKANKTEELRLLWNELEMEDHKLSKNDKTEKILNTSKMIESLKCKQKKIEIAVTHLKIKKDEELIDLLKNDGFEFKGDFKEDLARIERLCRDINVQIDKLEKQLPKPTENKQIPFDEIVIGYSMIVEQTFKPNEITQSEFRALEKHVKSRIESIEKQKAKNGRKR